MERGLKVVTSLSGRSDASAKRAAAAGMVAVSDAECAKADVFLSILPLLTKTFRHYQDKRKNKSAAE